MKLTDRTGYYSLGFTTFCSIIDGTIFSLVIIYHFSAILQILLQYYNSSVVRDGQAKMVVKFGATAYISGGQEANYSIPAPKVMYYSARGPDPEDSFLANADVLKPNLVAPGNSIWAAWSSRGTDSVEFLGMKP